MNQFDPQSHAQDDRMSDEAQRVTIAIDGAQSVSGPLLAPAGGRGIATLRYQFPYMERGSSRARISSRAASRSAAA